MDRLYYDLGADEIFVKVQWNHRGKVYSAKHFFRHPKIEEAEEYLQGMKSSNRALDGNILESDFDSTEADLKLWDKLSRRVEGYIDARLGDLMSQENWRDLVPATHKQMAAQGIYYLGLSKGATEGGTGSAQGASPVAPSEDTSTIDVQGGLEVSLDAAQNGQLITGLVHCFRYPKPSELQQWKLMSTQSRVELRSRERNYVALNHLRQQIRLYDAMIQGTEGYKYKANGVLDPTEQARTMDPVHKQMAIKRAFELVWSEEVGKDVGGPLAETPSVSVSGS